MLGNDVVDLDLAAKESNWQRRGYLDKLFTLPEQELITEAENPSVMVWTLWSMKEAAYKAENRMTGRRVFAPKQLEGRILLSQGTGQVRSANQTFSIASSRCGSRLHTTAQVTSGQALVMHTCYLKNTARYREDFNLACADYLLKKNKDGLPVLIDRHTGKVYIASVSHHGRYLAVIYADFLL